MYCILGMPVDVIETVTVLRRMEAAAAIAPFLIFVRHRLVLDQKTGTGLD
jgi:hypothetical protein